MGKGLVAGKGMAHWRNSKKCGVGNPHSMRAQIPEALGAVMGSEQQVTWSGLTIQAPRHNSTGKVKAGGMEPSS